jgi:hypothetical protein
MSRQPTKNQWETLIRRLAAESANVFFTRHARTRMRERHITQMQVLEVLKRGVIRREPEPDLKSGHTQCLRIPRDGGHHSTVMADIVPPSSRTPFHGDGGQRSILKADTPAVF